MGQYFTLMDLTSIMVFDQYARRIRGWHKSYWINFVDLCKKFPGPEDELVKAKYFTAAPHKKVIRLEKNLKAFTDSQMPPIIYSTDGKDFATVPEKWK